MNNHIVTLRADGETYHYECDTREAALVLFKALCISHGHDCVAVSAILGGRWTAINVG